jgi:thiol-disulfide isomerase/thioredoxin
MENNKTNLTYILRGLIAILFLVSALAKLYPSPHFAITTFEIKQLMPLGFSEGVAQILSRLLIGVEFALGFLILQPHYIKKVIIPATIALLAVFIIQLSIEIAVNGNEGNCGCFGTLLPMTPIEAIIKNIVAIGLLAWLLVLLRPIVDKRNPWVLIGVTGVCIAAVIIAVQVTKGTTETGVVVYEGADTITNTTTAPDSVAPVTDTTALPKAATPINSQPAATTPADAIKPAQQEGPKAVTSPYAKYFANADTGKKIIALFAPGCEHCRDTAKQLTEMKAKDKNFPEVYIVFMDEEADLIPDFFKFAGKKYPYTVLDVGTFWKVLGMSKDTPGVIYQWNGNKIKEWDGINERKFVATELQKALKLWKTKKNTNPSFLEWCFTL